MDAWRATANTCDPSTLRWVRDALGALQAQTETQRLRRAKRSKPVGRCAECGKPIRIDRRSRPGVPMYCRPMPGESRSRCKTAAYRRRLAQRVQEADQDGLAQIYEAEPAGPATARTAPAAGLHEPSPGPQPTQMDPLQLWMALHR